MEKIAEELKGDADAGIYIGRFNPMHVGHQAMIASILEAFGDKHLIMIGSSNHATSVRHIFDYAERAEFIQTVFPKARIVGIPDYDNDATWFRALDDLAKVAGIDLENVVYLGGSVADVQFYFDNQRKTRIINRFDGPTVKVSGEEIRDALINKRTRDLKKYLDPKICKLVQQRFQEKWAKFCKT